MLRFALIILLGIAGHQAKPLTDTFAKGFDNLSKYAVGVAMLAAGMLLITPKEKHHEFITRYFSVATMLGFGVVVGYVWDMIGNGELNGA